ncbi:MAG TPA: DMT family transporter [Streptosporangiaceae bacterium]|nr:DMT family transporter [Streptosporangiaceae bacterium]
MGDQHLTTRAKSAALGLALLSSVCFGSSGPFAKALIHAGLSPLQAVWLRVAGAALVLVPVTLALRGTAGFRAAGRRGLPLLVIFGVTGVAGCQACYFVAAARLPVGVAILLEYTGPVLVVAWLRFVRHVPVARSAATGVAVALTGVACVVQVWAGLRLDGIGLLAGFGAAASQAAYFLIAKRMTADTDPLVLTSAGFVVGAAVLTPLAAPWSLPWDLLPADVMFAGRPAPAWLIAAWIIVVSTVVAYVTSVLVVRRLPAPVAAAVSYPEAVAATMFAWLILGEQLAAVQIMGGLIVLAGAFIAQRAVAADRPVAVPAGEAAAAAPFAAR